MERGKLGLNRHNHTGMPGELRVTLTERREGSGQSSTGRDVRKTLKGSSRDELEKKGWRRGMQ